MAAAGVRSDGVRGDRAGGRVHRVLVEELAAGEVVLRGPEAHHLATVLRVRPGAPVEAFDGKGRQASGVVSVVSREGVTLSLGEPEAARVEAPLSLTLAVALLKGDKLSGVVRQGTELGVSRFVLLSTRFADRASLSGNRLTRLERVAEEAARQSGRVAVPAVEGPLPLERLEWEGAALVAHVGAERSLSDLLSDGILEGRSAATVVTGPEGGLADDEVEALEGRGAHVLSLGPRILRAETAPVAVAAALLLPAGR